MKSFEYDSVQTAQMVSGVLLETLGLMVDALCIKCHHFIYDGMYCSNEERLHGGGGLSLSNTFCEVLILEEGDVTGNHDMSHNLQLVYSDVFKHDTTGDKKIEKIVQHVYAVMSDYNTGQAGSIFMEAASKMNRVVLTNK